MNNSENNIAIQNMVCYIDTRIRQRRNGCDYVNGYTVFDLLADIVSMLLAAQDNRIGHSLVCLGADPLSADMRRFRDYLQKLEELLNNGIQIPTHLYRQIRVDAEQCVQRGNIQGVQILVKVLETVIGDFHQNYHRMNYIGASWKSIHPIPPLNQNYATVHVKLYPAACVEWMNSYETDALLDRYVVVTPEMEKESHIQCVYVKRTTLQNVLAEKRRLDIALSPISCTETTETFTKVILENGKPMNVGERVIRIAEAALKQGCDIIAFPEATVERNVIARLRNLLQSYSEQPVLLISPVYYEEHRKRMMIFGKNGRVLYEFIQSDEKPEQGLLIIDRVCGLLVPLQTQEDQYMCLNTGAGKFLAEQMDKSGVCEMKLKQPERSDGCEGCDTDMCYYEISVSRTEDGFQYKCNYKTA